MAWLCLVLYVLGFGATAWGAVSAWLNARRSVRAAQEEVDRRNALKEEIRVQFEAMKNNPGEKSIQELSDERSALTRRRYEEEGLEMTTFQSFDPSGAATASKVLQIVASGNGLNAFLVLGGAAVQTLSSVLSLFFE